MEFGNEKRIDAANSGKHIGQRADKTFLGDYFAQADAGAGGKVFFGYRHGFEVRMRFKEAANLPFALAFGDGTNTIYQDSVGFEGAGNLFKNFFLQRGLLGSVIFIFKMDEFGVAAEYAGCRTGGVQDNGGESRAVIILQEAGGVVINYFRHGQLQARDGFPQGWLALGRRIQRGYIGAGR